MKQIFGAILLFAGLHAQAQELTEMKVTNFAAMTTFLVTIDSIANSSNELEKEIYDRAEYYKSLSFFQLVEKNRIQRENCGYIQAHTFSTGITISVSVETFQNELKIFFKKNDQVNQQEALSKLSLITSYIKKLNSVTENCMNPTKSFKLLKLANKDLNEVNTYLLETIKPIVDSQIFDKQ